MCVRVCVAPGVVEDPERCGSGSSSSSSRSMIRQIEVVRLASFFLFPFTIFYFS